MRWKQEKPEMRSPHIANWESCSNRKTPGNDNNKNLYFIENMPEKLITLKYIYQKINRKYMCSTQEVRKKFWTSKPKKSREGYKVLRTKGMINKVNQKLVIWMRSLSGSPEEWWPIKQKGLGILVMSFLVRCWLHAGSLKGHGASRRRSVFFICTQLW